MKISEFPFFLFYLMPLYFMGALIPSAAAETEITITVTEDLTLINGEKFLLSPSVSKLLKLWGRPDRELDLQNEIRIWDHLGVRAYSAKGASSADTISFTMQKQDSKIAAKEVFTGKIHLPGGVITRTTKAADLRALGFRQDDVLAKFYRMELLSASFLAEIDPGSGALVSLSMDFGL